MVNRVLFQDLFKKGREAEAVLLFTERILKQVPCERLTIAVDAVGERRAASPDAMPPP